MKKCFAILIAITLVLSFAITAKAGEDTNGPVDKLGRGAANIATAPFELIDGMAEENEKNGMIAGLTTGFLKGVIGTIRRAVVGGYEAATFPLPVTGDYDPIIEDKKLYGDTRRDRYTR